VRILVALLLGACAGGHPPDIVGLSDQVAYVGTQLTVELDGTDPDGDMLTYGVHADVSLDGAASITQTPTGTGIFRWTPLAEDIGSHVFDFTATDGSHTTTVSISIEVRAATGSAPVFVQPLGTGTVVDLKTTPCMMVSVVVQDPDTPQVDLAQEAPVIDGAQLAPIDGQSASWTWCPTAAQVMAQDRYTLVLSADDHDNPKTIKDYVIVLSGKPPTLVINEVDYDQVGTDLAEYVEILNPGGADASLAGLVLVLVNGSTSAEYSRVDLSSVGTLAAGQYLVIAGTGVTVPTSAIKLDPLWTQDAIQNGSPDGIALVDTVTHTVIDALSYEGAITAATITGFPAPVSLVEGTALSTSVADSNTANGTLCRYPDGQDTNDANTDWRFCTKVTVGTANMP
jgi:hypothetical protein